MNSYYPSSAPRPKINGDRNQSMIEMDVFLCNRTIIYPPSSKHMRRALPLGFWQKQTISKSVT